MYLLNKRMPDSNTYIHVYTKSRIKTSKLKERIKKGNATGLEPTSIECKGQALIHKAIEDFFNSSRQSELCK